ncbi:hypothetical protein Dimus_002839, partial [Dionaea muscipula]
ARPPWKASCAWRYPHVGAATKLGEMANHDYGGDELVVKGVLGLRPELGELPCLDLNLHAWCAHARLPREEIEDCRARRGS